MTSSRARHYVPLREWSPILATPGVHFVNLQYSDYAEDIAQANAGGKPAIHHFHDLNLRDALDEVAALISALDLVITICNVNMDLSGALGKETWLFAFRHAMTWATLGCDDTPWFPGVRLFGRSWDQTWEGAVANVAAALRERVPPAS